MGAMVAGPASATTQASEQAYYVVRQPVSQFLDQLEQDTGVQIDVSARIPGTIIATSVEGDVEAVLSTLSRRFGFHWFFFNNVYYISPVSEGEMRLVRLNDISSAMAQQALADAGLLSDRFPVIEAAQGKAIALTGPPKMLALSEAIIESLVPDAPTPLSPQAPSPTKSAAAQQEQERDTLLLYRGTSLSVIE